jgi:5-(carboxyamino)imidazole ribonucleotide synthase
MASQTIGIVGGGQLGRMLTIAALPLGFKVVVVDPGGNSPAAQVGAEQIIADLHDETALKQLANQSDFITIEIEHVDAKLLAEINDLGTPVNPAPATIALIQDKFAQKQFLEQAGIPVASYVEITDEASAQQALKDFDGQILIKAKHGAYDGRGNRVIKHSEDIATALKHFEGKELYAEKLIPFQKELAIMVARDWEGDVKAYPVAETIQERNICTEVLVPAPIDETLQQKAREVGLQVANHLKGAGIFGIEMFLSQDGEIIVNEIAPRVHNSGHYTTEACATSQFEQHIRAIAGLPLGPTDLVVPASVMINILGERDGPVQLEGLEVAESQPETTVHLYGKSPTKVDRKMGHITATGATLEEARDRARKARQAISI